MVGGWDELETAGPGAFLWATKNDSEELASIIFNCPGCGLTGGCRVAPFDDGRPAWTFNGNREAPTLTPSIHIHCCGWHGYLTDGEFRLV